MGIREKLNENPALTTGITAGVVLLALLFILYQLGLFSGGGGVRADGEIYFSDDNGASFVPGPAADIFAMGPDGEPRVRAHVFQYPGQDPQIAYLSRFHPEAVALVERARANPDDEQLQMQVTTLEFNAREVRRPGENEWFNSNSPTGMEIASPPPRNAEGQAAREVLP